MSHVVKKIIAVYMDQDMASHGLAAILGKTFEVILAQPGIKNVAELYILGGLHLVNLETMKERAPVIVVNDNIHDTISYIRQGASGVLHYHSREVDIKSCVHHVLDGKVWLEQSTLSRALFAKRINRASRYQGLTSRQIQIACLVTEGYRNSEIGDKLHISEQTVKNHLHTIFRATGTEDRTGLAVYVTQNNLGQLGQPEPVGPTVPMEV